jgi:hypothetical protein
MAKLDKCPLCGGTNLEYYGPKFVPDNYCNDCKKFVWDKDIKK